MKLSYIPVLDQSMLLGMTPSFLLLLTMSNVDFNIFYVHTENWIFSDM